MLEVLRNRMVRKLAEITFVVVLLAMITAWFAAIYLAVFLGSIANGAIELVLPALRPAESWISFVAFVGGFIGGIWLMFRVLRWSRRAAGAVGISWSTDDGVVAREVEEPRPPDEPRRRLDRQTISDLDARLALPSAGRESPPEQSQR